MPSPGNQFLSDEFGDIEDYFISDYQLIDQYIGDQLWTWGRNTNGNLGVNNAVNRNTPVTTFTGGTNWKSISCGAGHLSALKTDGTLWIWGSNGDTVGQLGDGTTGGGARSTPVTTRFGGTNWKSIGFGWDISAAIKTDGTLWTWGDNNDGQLGVNNATARNTPVTTILGGNNWKSIAGGRAHMAAIKTDGTLWVWGRNTEAQLGINDASGDRSTPVTTFAGGTNWKQVACGGYHITAIKTDGTLWIWGRNNFGQLGINDTSNRTTPVTTFLGGTNWKSVTCGDDHTLAIKTDGTLWIWGKNDRGQLGIRVDVLNRTTPVTTFAGGTNWKSAAGGNNTSTSAAIKTDGTLWIWGNNNNGQLGINDNNNRTTPVTTFLGGTNWKSVDIGEDYCVAIQSGLNVDFS